MRPLYVAGYGMEPGVRVYQLEIGAQLVETATIGNSVSTRPIDTEWGHGFVWKPSGSDQTPFGHLRFRACTLGAVCTAY